MDLKGIVKSGAGWINLILLTGLAVMLSAEISDAATLVVTNLNNSGAGSLRDTIAAASAGDTIKFGVTGTITLTSGQLVVTKDLAVIGPGASILEISQSTASSVFYVDVGTNLFISGLTISNGNASSGGGISNNGTLNVVDVFFSNNTASIGGALSSQNGPAVITGSTFSGNSALYGGGAIITTTGEMTITDCTFTDNQGEYGGGINTANAGSVTVRNSTFNNNGANFSGGAISADYTVNTVTLLNCTFSGNQSPRGGALYISDGVTVNASNTIFADSASGSNCNMAITGTNSHNIDFGGPAPANSCGADITDDPVLGSLTDNGGQTQTMALGTGSSAIDAGAQSNAPSADQRGWPRPYGTAVDVGAVESMPEATLTVNRTGNGTVKSSPAGVFCATGCSSDPSVFPLNGTVSLSAIPDPGTDIFSPGWSGTGCGRTVSMTGDRTCSAAFTHCGGNPVSTPAQSFPSIMEAYGQGATEVFVTASHRLENLAFNDHTIILNGGKACDFQSIVDYTYVDGYILIIGGAAILDRVVVL
ncbi:MAG: hypothetical protein M0Z67_07275 [Nitrospiraceae bacterium]|nr:hypothetical protein [Nitrospiraceae bacterium]